MFTLSIIVCVIYITQTHSQISFSNSTSVILLEPIFYNESSSNTNTLIRLEPTHQTSYYMDPITNKKYPWIGSWAWINNTATSNSIISWLKSDIFDENFKQYNNKNNSINKALPFTITNEYQFNSSFGSRVFENLMCTSPITKDIITCFMNQTYFDNQQKLEYALNVECKIFYYKTNTFSETIYLTAPFDNNLYRNTTEGVYNFAYRPLCFDDGYFMPYEFATEIPTTNISILGNIIDLNGNVINGQINLNLNITTNNHILNIQGSNKFNVDLVKINKNVSGSFMIAYILYDENNNITNIAAGYGIYTNINDSNPMTIYKEISNIQQNNKIIGTQNFRLESPATMDYTQNCCYITVYRYNQNLYGIITDIVFITLHQSFIIHA